MFWQPTRAGAQYFGNVQCLSFAPHTIPLRNRKDHLIILLNSHENHPGSKMNHPPFSHRLCSVLKLLKCPASVASRSFSKLSQVPFLLFGFMPTLIFCYTGLEKQFSASQKEPWHLQDRTSNSLVIFSPRPLDLLWVGWGERCSEGLSQSTYCTCWSWCFSLIHERC